MSTNKEQSRMKFERSMLRANPCVRLSRQREEVGGEYKTITVQRAWLLWSEAWMLGAYEGRREVEEAVGAGGVQPLISSPAKAVVAQPQDDAADAAELRMLLARIKRALREAGTFVAHNPENGRKILRWVSDRSAVLSPHKAKP